MEHKRGKAVTRCLFWNGFSMYASHDSHPPRKVVLDTWLITLRNVITPCGVIRLAVLIAECVSSDSLWWWSGYAYVMADDSQFREWTQLAAPLPQVIKATVILFTLSMDHLSFYTGATVHGFSNYSRYFSPRFHSSCVWTLIIGPLILYSAGKTLSEAM